MSQWDLPPLTPEELEARRAQADPPATGSDPEALAALRIDTLNAQKPSVVPLLARDDSRAVLIQGVRHLLFGPPGCGKSMLSIIAAKAAIQAGGAVVWLDWESPPWRTRWRWDHLGMDQVVMASPRAWHQYQVPALIEPENRPALHALLAAIQSLSSKGKPVLVVVDSASAAGVPRDTGEAVAPWWGILANVWMEAGATVLIIDHSPHGDPSRPVGSGDKTAQVDLSLRAIGGPCWTPETDGEVRLQVAKDRDGLVGQTGDSLATFVGTWATRHSPALGVDERSFSLAIKPPGEGITVADRVRAFLAENPDELHSQAAIERAVTGNSEAIRETVRQLHEAGALASAPVRGGGTGYALAR